MSEIKLKRIISFTSEDDVHKAENLLNHGGKWLCAKKTDQTKHSVTIQLEKETKIRQVNIENEFSAFVEVWIGPEGAKNDDDFKTLLEATSFMTPGDSKNSTNGNRLKIFTNESLLNKAACELDSGVVKILCTQPFNKDIQFGIGSIKLFDKVNNDDVKDAAKLNTGVFSLKKELSDSKPVPSSPKVEPKKVVEEEEEKKSSPAKESLYDKWKKNNKTATAYDSSDEDKADKKKSDDESKPTTSSAARNSDSKPGRRSNEEKPGNGANSILRGVIFALSGFVNPLRSEIRDKGMKLGAKYRPDWTDDCTHLVTAFSNTPKVKQVKKAKKGAIVTKDWIYECEKAGKRLDANDYEVASDSDSSDDDDDSKPRRAAKVAVAKIAKMKKRDELLDSDEEEEEAENSDDRDFIVGSDEEEEDDDVSESESESSNSSSSSSDEDRKKKKKRKKANKKKEKKEKKLTKKKTASKRPAKKDSSSSSSGSDSESDLEKYKKKKESEIKKQKQKKMKKDDDKEESNDDKENLKKEAAKKPTDLKKSASSSSSKTVVNSDMEENEDNSASWKLPTFFDEKIFFVVPDYDAKKRKALSRIIYAYGGNVSDYMSDEVDYVITDKQWDKDFDEALKENNKLKFIESDWLNTCNSRKKLIPYQPFEIVRDL